MPVDVGSDSSPLTAPSVNIWRSFPIRRERLFQLWIEPAHLAQWWGPVGWKFIRCELDSRANGRWCTWLRTARGEERTIGGRYLEVVPPERLVFTWEFPSTDSASPQISIVTVHFTSSGEHTELTLEHRKLSQGQKVDMDVGWASTFDSLAQYIRATFSQP